MIDAVVFDLDGVLLQSEEVWDAVRERYVRERGGRYDDEVQRAMMGMSAPEWSTFLAEDAGVPASPEQINADVVELMLEAYPRELPLLPGAVEVVRSLAAAFPLALASSSNRAIFEEVLRLAGIADCFAATVSSEEVARGKPAPDVYLEAARRLGVASGALRRGRGLALRDPLRARRRNARHRDPEPELSARRRRRSALADVTLSSLNELTFATVRSA